MLHQLKGDNSPRRWCPKGIWRFDPRYGWWRWTCGSTKCSRECRDAWARKYGLSALRSFRTLPPTAFVVVRHPEPIATPVFTRAVHRILERVRKEFGGAVQYLCVYEFTRGRPHAHLLLRTALPAAAVRAVIRSALPTGFTLTYQPVRNPQHVARYVFKHTRRRARKAELTPPDFAGRVFTASRGFFTKPLEDLWVEVRQEWKMNLPRGRGQWESGVSFPDQETHR